MQNSFMQVGNTPLIKLSVLKPEEGASIWLKVESGNPTGSYKDRMAISVIGQALRQGKLSLKQTVVEYTGGSTGSALAGSARAHTHSVKGCREGEPSFQSKFLLTAYWMCAAASS